MRWHQELSDTGTIAAVVAVTNAYLASLSGFVRREVPASVLPASVQGEHDIHRCYNALVGLFTTPAVRQLDPEIQEACVFFVRASARCLELGRNPRASDIANDTCPGLRLQLSSGTSNSSRKRSR